MHSITEAKIVILIVVMVVGGCTTMPNVDPAVDWQLVLEKAELSLEMAHQVYALWDLTHELLGTPEDDISEKRKAFESAIREAETYVAYVKGFIDG